MAELQISAATMTGADELDGLSALDRFFSKNSLKGLEIYIRGFLFWRIWIHMAVSEIHRRYRRTLLGPFWVTLSVGIFIGTMGVIFPRLWHVDTKAFLPFFASGFIIWTFVSTSIIEACGTFLDMSVLIKQLPLPYSVYANTVVARNVIILLHHLIVYLAIILIFRVPLNLNTLLFFPAMLILCLTISWVSVLFGLFSARYRDIKQVISSFLQIALFVTPVLWMPSQLGSSWQAKLFIMLNPLSHLVAIARAPLLGQQPTLSNWGASIGICIVGWLFTMKILSKYYRHLVFWL